MRYSHLVFTIIIIFVGSFASGKYVHISERSNLSKEETFELVCQTALTSVSALAPLTDNSYLIEKFQTQLKKMVRSGAMTSKELQEAQLVSASVEASKVTIHLIRVGEGKRERYFYIYPVRFDSWSSWNRLGTAQAVKELGSTLILKNGFSILQTDHDYKFVNRGPKTADFSKYYFSYEDGPGKLANTYNPKFVHKNALHARDAGFSNNDHGDWKSWPLFHVPQGLRYLTEPADAPLRDSLQFLLDIGILTTKRLETSKYYSAQILKTGRSFDILEFDSDGPETKKISIYFMPAYKRDGAFSHLEFGLLGSPECVKRFGDQFALDDGQVMAVKHLVEQDAPSGQSRLQQITGAIDSTLPINKIFESNEVEKAERELVPGPSDLEAYEKERIAIQNLKPELDANSLVSIHSFSEPIDDAIAALNHKKRALQKYVFNESFWSGDAEMVGQIIASAQINTKIDRAETDEILGRIIKTRRGDLIKYLEYLTQIKETSDAIDLKVNESRAFLSTQTSLKFPADLSEVQDHLNKYMLIIVGNRKRIESELTGVTQTIEYFKAINLMLAASSSDQNVNTPLLRELRVLREILTSLSTKDMKGLQISSQEKVGP